MNKLHSFLSLVRPVNCIMMGLAVVVGGALANSSSLSTSWIRFALGFITGFTLTAASMVINDYHDREIDKINEPMRPIPSGRVKPREAFLLSTFLAAAGFAIAYLTSLLNLATAIVAWMMLILYTTVGKRSGLPGNFLVSACVAIPFVYGSIAVAETLTLNVILFAAMAFLSNSGREVTKGIVDVEGDRTGDVKTIAARYGENKAAEVAAFFYLFAAVLSPIPWLLGLVSFWFIPPVAVTDAGLVASSIAIVKDCSRESARRIKKFILLWFAIGLLAFILGVRG